MRRRRSARSLCGSGSSLAASLLSKPQIGQQERAAAVQGPSRHRDVRVHAQHDGQADDEYRLPESPRLPQRRAPLCEPEVSESKAGVVDLRNRPLPIAIGCESRGRLPRCGHLFLPERRESRFTGRILSGDV